MPAKNADLRGVGMGYEEDGGYKQLAPLATMTGCQLTCTCCVVLVGCVL